MVPIFLMSETNAIISVSETDLVVNPEKLQCYMIGMKIGIISKDSQ